ncbi:hypothetical protein MIR68_012096 [Amoeboaphelidium protococcarum]|nr:hypothetical protein MIR68_012096 [Amoeboaphelidium protococcarum]
MSFLFKPKTKSPAELVKHTKDLFIKFGPVSNVGQVGGVGGPSAATTSATNIAGNASLEPVDAKTQEELSKNLVLIKNILTGGSGSGSGSSSNAGGGSSSGGGGNDSDEANLEQISQLSIEIYNSDLLSLMIFHMQRIEFEAKKDVAQIFINLLRRQIGTRSPTVEYLCNKSDVLTTLFCSYEVPDIALQCGLILRDCIRYEALCKLIFSIEDPVQSGSGGRPLLFWRMFGYVDLGTFDVASDAFATFKELLVRHRAVVSEFLDKNYDEFFERYLGLLTSNNYVTKRQSLKLLGELLLDRSNFNVMTRYISSVDNLKLMMNLLRDRSKNIQFEAFHVFKVFAANPNKTAPVKDILVKNKDKLVKFLSEFCTDRTEDEQFNDEKAFLIKQIQEL